MFKRKYRPYFTDKICDICGEKANIFRCIEGRTYMLCDNKKCDFIVRVKHGWHMPIIGN